MMALDDPHSSPAENAVSPGTEAEKSIRALVQKANEKADDAGQIKKDVEQISGKKGMITHRELYMADPFFSITKVLFILLVGSTVMLAALMCIIDIWLLPQPEIELLTQMTNLIRWAIIPLLTFVIGYAFGSARPK